MRKLICAALTAATLTACTNIDSEFSSHYCYFIFNGSLHATSYVITACTGYETYAIVYTTPLSGSTYTVVAELYNGEKSTDNITTQQETNTTHSLGIANGLIIGRSTLDQTLYVFDRQCPNCYNDAGYANSQLQWGDDSHTVRCSKCEREYNLSNGGVISAGTSGSKLFRYICTYYESSMMLYVHNK